MYNNKILILGYLLKNNFIDYLKLSMSHFFGQWVAGFKQEYLKKIIYLNLSRFYFLQEELKLQTL